VAEVTVSQFADVLKVPVEKLLSQLENAGIKVAGSEDKISEDAKLLLLTYLRKSHGEKDGGRAGAAPEKITLKRKSQSEIKLSGSQGRSRTVNVEIRKKRTYVQREVLEADSIKKQEILEKKSEKKKILRLKKRRMMN
jgi:translation initiation factor IF-2